jgi:hypothetical protein
MKTSNKKHHLGLTAGELAALQSKMTEQYELSLQLWIQNQALTASRNLFEYGSQNKTPYWP